MGPVRKGILILAWMSWGCSPDPELHLNQRLPSTWVYQEGSLQTLGGWRELEYLTPTPLDEEAPVIPLAEELLIASGEGVGRVFWDGKGLRWEGFVPPVRELRGYWKREGLYVFAAAPERRLYRWSPPAAPEPILIPSLLAEASLPLRQVILSEGEWLLYWGEPANRWTLFHQKLGLERQLTAEEVRRALRAASPRPLNDLAPEWVPHLPSGRVRLQIDDPNQSPSVLLYGFEGAPTAWGLRRGQEVWLLWPDGQVRGSHGSVNPSRVGGLRWTGVGALGPGLACVWQRPTQRGVGFWGVVLYPWQYLHHGGTLKE